MTLRKAHMHNAGKDLGISLSCKDFLTAEILKVADEFKDLGDFSVSFSIISNRGNYVLGFVLSTGV